MPKKFPTKQEVTYEPKVGIRVYTGRKMPDRYDGRELTTIFDDIINADVITGNKLSNDEREKISGKIGTKRSFFSNEKMMFGDIYNGNLHVSLTSIVISVWSENRSEKYILDLPIQPHKKKSFSLPFNWPENETFSWNIYEAYGTR